MTLKSNFITERIRYPENLYLRVKLFESGRTFKDVAGAIGVSRQILTTTINGHYKGANVVLKLRQELGLNDV